MIKFYQGTYSELSDKLNSINNICFVTDRQVLIMGGKEYGKDGGAIKVEATSGQTAATGSRDVITGTLFAFTGDNSIYRYNSASNWEVIIPPTLSSADFIDEVSGGTYGATTYTDRTTDAFKATAADVKSATSNLENKVATAYSDAPTIDPVSGTNTVVVSKPAGIARTAYTLNQDRNLISVKTDGTGARSVANSTTDNILVTETTLSEQTNDILANGLEIRKLTQTSDGYNAGYRSQYGLYNKQNGLRLGATIDLIKDQFLRGAEYVAAYEKVGTDSSITYIDWPANEATRPSGIPDNTSRDSLNRYLKLTFALPATEGKSTDGTSGQISPDSSDTTYTGETDTTIYINVNELFDSYKSGAGVTVDQSTNTLSAQIDSALNESGTHYTDKFLTVDGAGLKIQGIKQEISGEVADIGSYDGSNTTNYNTNNAYPKFVTKIGINPATNALTGQASGLFASGIEYEGSTGTGVLLTNSAKALTIADKSVEAAIDDIATHVGSLDYEYNGTTGAAVTQFIYAITQVDGLIATSAKIVDANDLKATAYAGSAQTYTKVIDGKGVNGVQAGGNIGQIYTVSQAAGTSGSLQNALQTIVDSTTNYLAALDLAAQGVSGNVHETTNKSYVAGDGIVAPVANTFVRHIEQENGLVNVELMDLTAQNTEFDGIVGTNGAGMKATASWDKTAAGYIPVNGYNVGAALSSISNYIGNLDYDSGINGSVTPSNGTANMVYAINHITQDNGLVSASFTPLSVDNFYFPGIAGVATGASGAVRVAVPQGSLLAAIDSISNTIADYGSFHNADGNVI